MNACMMILLAGAATLAGGCAVLQSPTPKNDMQMDRNALVRRANGDERTAPISTLRVPEQWATGAVKIQIARRYANHEGAEVLVEEIVTYDRTSDAGPAGAIAAQRSADTVALVTGVSTAVGTAVSQGIAGIVATRLAGIDADREIKISREQEKTRRAIIAAETAEAAEATKTIQPPAAPAPGQSTTVTPTGS